MVRQNACLHWALTALIGASAQVHGQSAFAQSEEDSFALEEVVVTAQRRSEVLRDVPISISVFQGEALQDSGINRLSEIRQSTPNVYFEDSGGAISGEPVMRGVTSSNSGVSFDPAVGVYVDGVFLGRDRTFSQELVDIERIEVLRGPQGTLYGRNAVGGAINIITRRPDQTTRGTARIEAGNYSNLRTSASLSGPVVDDKLFAGVAASYSERDGYSTNVLLSRNIGDNSNRSGTLRLRATPTERLEINLVASASHDRGTAAQIDDSIGPGTDPTSPFPVGLLFGYQSQNPFDRKIAFDVMPLEDLKQKGLSATVDFQIAEGLNLTSISAYRDLELQYQSDIDRTPYALFPGGFAEDSEQFSQELRLSTPTEASLSAVVGLFYFHQRAHEDLSIRLDRDLSRVLAPLVGIDPQLVSNQANRALSQVDTDSFAAFGEATYRFTDHLHLTAGARVSREEKKFAIEQTVSGEPVQLYNVLGIYPFERFSQEYGETDVSPSLSLRYVTDDGSMLYARTARGFKPGGFNARSPSTNPDGTVEDLSFGAESLWNYEVGAKADFFGHRLRTNLAVFYMRHDDKQVTTFDGIRERTSNAAQAESKGVELELTARALPNLDLTAGIGYVDAKYKNFLGLPIDATDPSSPRMDYSGHRVPGVPDWTINTSAEYRIPFDSVEMRLRGEYSYIGSIVNTLDQDPQLTEDGYSIVNASVGAGFGDSFEAMAYVRNAFDETYLSGGFSQVHLTGLKHINLGAPRTYGVSVRYRF